MGVERWLVGEDGTVSDRLIGGRKAEESCISGFWLEDLYHHLNFQCVFATVHACDVFVCVPIFVCAFVCM